MKAYDIAGRRKNVGIRQLILAQRLGWYEQTLRDVENGCVEISEEQYEAIREALEELTTEEKGREAVVA